MTRVPRAIVLGAVTSVMLIAAGCASSDRPTASSAGASTISAARCAQNKAAGTIEYLTGYQFQASASILGVVAADALGYFHDLCLQVDLKPGTGDIGVNTRLVAAGTVAVSDVGSESDLMVARSHGVDVVGVATSGHVPIDTLMTRCRGGANTYAGPMAPTRWQHSSSLLVTGSTDIWGLYADKVVAVPVDSQEIVSLPN